MNEARREREVKRSKVKREERIAAHLKSHFFFFGSFADNLFFVTRKTFFFYLPVSRRSTSGWSPCPTISHAFFRSTSCPPIAYVAYQMCN